MVKVFLSFLVLSLLFFILPQTASGQFSGGEMGINGLTCSQCSRSVEMELRKLPFLENIVMNLEHNECTFTIKKSSDFSVFAIRDAVRNAGFSVRFLHLEFTGSLNDSKSCFRRNNVVYQFTTPAGAIPTNRLYQVLGAHFLPAREWRKITIKASNDCTGSQIVFLRPVSPG